MTMDAERARRPEIILAEMIRQHARGSKQDRMLYRAAVVAVDSTGGRLQNENGEGSLVVQLFGTTRTYKASVGPSNPPGSIKAVLLNDGADSITPDVEIGVFWPLNELSSVLPGEHVVVMFEDAAREHGLWIARVPGHTALNFAPGSRLYTGVDASSAMDSFEPNRPSYQTDDLHASESPPVDLTKLFGD